MGASSTYMTLLSILILLLSVAVDPVAAYVYYYNSWYIYVVVVFVIIAISSCIGACVRYKRNQMFLEQQRIIVAQRTPGINVTTAGGNINGGYYPSSYPTGAHPPPPGGYVQNPPAYSTAGAQPEKDPNMPPAYEEALNAPSFAATNQHGNAPYPTQPAPYPIQPAPYPTQPNPYTQGSAP